MKKTRKCNRNWFAFLPAYLAVLLILSLFLNSNGFPSIKPDVLKSHVRLIVYANVKERPSHWLLRLSSQREELLALERCFQSPLQVQV